MPRPNFRPFSQFPKAFADIFWPYVLGGEITECWPWLGQENVSGYGQFFAEHKLWTSHRVAYYLHYGIDPGAKEVCHHCDNPPCNNPYHLFLGTHQENMQDSLDKGRMIPVKARRGMESKIAKLTDSDIRVIRQLRAKGETFAALSKRFGVCQMNIWNIIAGTTWKHVL